MLLIAVVMALSFAPAGGARHEYRPIQRVWVRTIIQQPYQPVRFVIDFNIARSAQLDQNLTADYQILDGSRNLVYSKKLTTSDIFQTSYYNSEITLTWNKRGLDGIVVPRGRSYYVRPLITASHPGPPYPGPLQAVWGPAKKFILH